MNLLLLAASHRPESLNHRLLQAAEQWLSPRRISCEWVDYAACDLPPYSDVTLTGSGVPEPAGMLGRRIAQTDGLVIATPEYNWSYPGSLKNIIDWLSRIEPVPLAGKPCLLLSATPSVRGGALALTHLKIPLEALGAMTYPGMFALGEAHHAFDEGGLLKDPARRGVFETMLAGFIHMTRKLIS